MNNNIQRFVLWDELNEALDDAENQYIIRREIFPKADPFDLPDVKFLKLFRLTKVLCQNLIETVKHYIHEHNRRSALTVRTKVLAALRFFGYGSYQEITGSNNYIGISQSSMSRSIKEVCHALNQPNILNHWVHFPRNIPEMQDLRTRTNSLMDDERINSATMVEEESSFPESDHLNRLNPEYELNGRRIVDIKFLFGQILTGERHFPFDCSIVNMQIIREINNGLNGEFVLQCKMRLCIKTITTEDKTKTKINNTNSALVLGCISTGLGHSQISEIAASLNMPIMCRNTFNDYHEIVAKLIREANFENLEAAAAEEAHLARQAGNIDENGIPCITVVTDGAWGKRSYNVNYDSMSGVACIIGLNTGKILFLGVRNKYCLLCSWYQSKGKDIREHKCYINWSGTSTAMETDIIAEGFQKSVLLYNIKFTQMVGDGDSSVYRKLLQLKPYGNQLVQKIECKNHLLRNFAKKVREICNRRRSNSKNLPVSFALRKEVFGRFMRLRTAITKATSYRIKEDTALDKKVELLRGDIANAPSHVYGEHGKCKELKYFECNHENDKSLVPSMKQCGIYEDLMTALKRLLDNTSSLVMNMDNNLAEHYNNLVCKFVGGKRVNFSLRGSYQTRCEAAAVSYNTSGQYYKVLGKLASGKSPTAYTKRFVDSRVKQRNLVKARKRLFSNKKIKSSKPFPPNKDYGPDANYIPLDLESDVYKNKAMQFLKKLQKSSEEISVIEKNTIGQGSNPNWMQERSLRITASNFGQICKMRAKTPRRNTVKNLLYGSFWGNKATKYGKDSECVAIADFEKKFGITVTQCGLFIGKEHFYLGASPDGLIGESMLIEIKCPLTISKISPTQGIQEGKIKFADLVEDKLQLKRNHNYYYQVQGQLGITGRDSCFFVVWSPHGMLVEKIYRDENFWEKMVPKLQFFYENFLMPELIDPLHPKGLSIREIAGNGKQSIFDISSLSKK